MGTWWFEDNVLHHKIHKVNENSFNRGEVQIINKYDSIFNI